MKEIALALLLQYGLYIVAALVVGLFIIAAILTPILFKILVAFADKIKSEKISLRIKDALMKLELVVMKLLSAEESLYRQEILAALSDGKIDNAEVKAIVEKIATKALEILKPEMSTFTNYFAGTAVFDFVVSLVKGTLVEWVNKMAKDPNGPFVKLLPTPNQPK